MRREPDKKHESGAPIYSGYMFYGAFIWGGPFEKIEPGTEVVLKMASMRPAVFELITVEHKRDPDDMYIIEAYPVRYLEEE